MNLAFVLLSKPRLPDGEDIARTFSSFAPPQQSVRVADSEAERPEGGEILSLEFNTEERAFIALVPAAVPNREADERVQYSVSAMGTGWQLPDHCAHLVVTLLTDDGVPVIDNLSRFTSLVAAVAKCSDSVGVYWGNAGATHDAEFFVAVASEPGIVPRIMLWSGLSIAREEDRRLSLLSLGMQQQLDLPDLLLTAPPTSGNTALETFYDLLAYLAQRGEAFPENDTIGRSEDERLPVRYVPSPINPDVKVWRVELV